MLIALLNGERIEASRSIERGQPYVCPGCSHQMILKAGEKRVPHFAHLPGFECAWGEGETLQHLTAKKTLRDSFLARGLKAGCEHIVDCLPGDRLHEMAFLLLSRFSTPPFQSARLRLALLPMRVPASLKSGFRSCATSIAPRLGTIV